MTPKNRLSAIILHLAIGPVLLVSVYLPTDSGDDECL